MSHRTCFTVRVECWDRYQWTGHINDSRFTGLSPATNRKRTPQEVLRDLADQIDRACVNDVFAPFPEETNDDKD